MSETASTLPLLDLVLCLSQAVDSVSPLLADHHQRVAYIVSCLAEEQQLPEDRRRELVLAGALHDVGGLRLEERLSLLQFEAENTQRHAETGYDLLRTFAPFAHIAHLIRFHHIPWTHGAGAVFNGIEVPEDSHLLHLADRIAVLIRPEESILSQADQIRAGIWQQSGRMFKPEHVTLFMEVGKREAFWFDAVSRSLDVILRRSMAAETLNMNGEAMIDLARLFSAVIDFRSRFTATHTSGVAVTADFLARLAGFSHHDCWLMRLAGYLHDLGKLGVPPAVLEKKGRLTKDEADLVRIHPYLTDRILKPIEAFGTVRAWGSQHHEKLDGNGYPFHLKGNALSPGSRIMAVADTFVAVSEDRPYRVGMGYGEIMSVLDQMVAKSALDGDVVALLTRNRDEANALRIVAQAAVIEDYRRVSNPTACT